MGALAGIKNYLMLRFLAILRYVVKVKVKLGLTEMKYGIPGYFDYKGVPMFDRLISKERNKAIEQYDNFREDDILLFTYPKAGTHFTRDVITSIYKEKGIEASECFLEFKMPSLSSSKKSADGTVHSGPLADLESAASPRIIMTHWTWDLMPSAVQKGQVKVAHCIRNPKDVACSMFPFYTTMGVIENTTWSQFVTWFIEGNVFFGSYFKFLKEWYPHRNNPNMLNLCFEDMKQNLELSVKQTAKFLNIELTQDQVDHVVTANTFANKAKQMGKNHPIYRKGKSGGWRSKFTVEQNDRMDEWVEQEMQGMPELSIKYQ